MGFALPPVPATWRRIDVGRGLAFRDEANSGSIMIGGHCDRKDDDVPLEALTNHLVMGTTDREPIAEEAFPLDGREAKRTRLFAKLDGVKMGFDIVVLKKDGCVYDLVYVGKSDAFEKGASAFDSVVSGFRAMSQGPARED